jgi:hypothetical protein
MTSGDRVRQAVPGDIHKEELTPRNDRKLCIEDLPCSIGAPREREVIRVEKLCPVVEFQPGL